MHAMTEQLGDSARGLLSFVFTEARETLERSPEQVGRTLGMSGRTVRRLEDPDDEQRPRRTTLRSLAEFYGLDAGFMTTLASVEWENYKAAELAQRLAQLAGDDREPEDTEQLLALALRLARGSGARVHSSELMALAPGVPGVEDVPRLVDLFVSLDRRRQQLALTLLNELAAARDRDRFAHAQGFIEAAVPTGRTRR